jgi:flagellar motility protein MotE (MotC chaperone)
MNRKKHSSPFNMLLKIGVLAMAVLVALAITSPSPPVSDAASREEEAAVNAARQQLKELQNSISREMARHRADGLPAVELTPEEDETPDSDATPEQREQLERLRRNLALSTEPLDLGEENKSGQENEFDPDSLTLAEIKSQAEARSQTVQPYIDQELEDKKALLAAEEARLNLERQSMEQLRSDIEDRLAELKQVQAAMEAVANISGQQAEAIDEIKTSLEERQAKVLQVSKIIGQMKPAAGASVITMLRNDLAVEVVSKLSPRIAGRIMNAMPPEKAAIISALMASQNKVAAAENNQNQLVKELDEALQAAGSKAAQAARPAQAPAPAANPAASDNS